MKKNNKVYGFFIDPIVKKSNCIRKIYGEINEEETSICLSFGLQLSLRQDTVNLDKHICVYARGSSDDKNYLENSNKLYKIIEKKLELLDYEEYQNQWMAF